MKFELPNRMRDPVHGFIHYNNTERKIIDSRPFHRLRHIRQLSLTNYVYPGASHTRFEHSLGVMELAHRFFETLLNRNEKEVKNIFGNNKNDLNYAKRILRVSALLHDVGHLPFSHSAEELMSHEEIGCQIIRDSEITKIIKKEIDKEAPTLITNVLNKNSDIELKWLVVRKIISGEFDADRTDYLRRDSLHCGVEYGCFDYKRLLESVRLSSSRDGGLTLGIERGGVHTLESLIIARYLMFTQVYFHRTRRIFDHYLKEFFLRWGKDKIRSASDVLQYDDIQVTNALREIYENGGQDDISKLSKRIVERKPHSCLFESHDNVKDHELQAIEDLSNKLKKKYGEQLDIILDPATGTIHEFYTGKEYDKVESLMDLPVIDEKADETRPIRKESAIIENLPRLLRVVRIYGNVKTSSDKKRLRRECAESLKSLYL